jgi:hypothetical protein
MEDSPGWKIWAFILGLLLVVWIVCTVQYGFKEGYEIAMIIDGVFSVPFIIWFWSVGGFEGSEKDKESKREKEREKWLEK